MNEYKITLKATELQKILDILSQQPYNSVSSIIASIMSQVAIENDRKSNENA